MVSSKRFPEIGDRILAIENTMQALDFEDRILAIENTMQALDFEDRILAIENTLQEIPARNIDPVLLAEMGYRKFATRELSGFSSQLDLTGANFSQAIIRDAHTSAKMGTDIQGGQVVDSNFSNSDLRYANFTGSSISNSILNEVTASGISLSRSVVKNVNYISADLSLADPMHPSRFWFFFRLLLGASRDSL